MFTHILGNPKLLKRTFTIRGSSAGVPFETKIQASNSMEAVEIIKAQHKDVVIQMIQINKE